MKKFVKIAAIVVAVVLVIALVAPMVLRGKIAEIVKREANAMLDARLDFEKLDISLLRHFPRASLDLKGLTLVGEEPFAGDTIVAAQRISVVVNVMSLFGDEGFEVTKIILSESSWETYIFRMARNRRLMTFIRRCWRRNPIIRWLSSRWLLTINRQGRKNSTNSSWIHCC